MKNPAKAGFLKLCSVHSSDRMTEGRDGLAVLHRDDQRFAPLLVNDHSLSLG
jgi:hypothetical protein